MATPPSPTPVAARRDGCNVLVVGVKTPYQWGGAEVLADGLVAALTAAGCRADYLALPFFPAPIAHVYAAIHTCRLFEIAETNFGPIDRVITLKFPAYYLPHPRKTLWLLHQYRQMYELWDDPGVGFERVPGVEPLRAAVQEADRRWLGEHERRFCLSATVAARLRDSCALDSDVLFPPLPSRDEIVPEEAEPFFFFPSRLSPLKRQLLVVDALALTKAPVRVRFAGPADTPQAVAAMRDLAAALGVADRAVFDGWISEADKRRSYGACLGVIFPPRLEDFGYVALEAMWARKPVVTCRDSGGVLELVTDGETGLVADPTPAAIAEALDRLWLDRSLARRLGEHGRDRAAADRFTWPHVVDRLLG